MRLHTLRRRTGALAAAAALSLGLVAAGTGSATAATPAADPVGAAASWLSDQLAASGAVEGEYGPDGGLTADLVLALDAAGAGQSTAAEATRWLRDNVLFYTGFGDDSEFYAGAFAKLVNVALAQGEDPRAFGATARADLVAQLQALECGTPSRDCAPEDAGRFSDRSTYGDYSNSLGQSLALIGLQRTGVEPSQQSVDFLIGSQCDDGGFPVPFGGACTSDVDGTAFVIQALVAVGADRGVIDSAVAWLLGQQQSDGSFKGDGVSNSNSTGVAAQALVALGGQDDAVAAAEDYIRTLQIGCDGPGDLRGAIAYDSADSGERVRATAQALPGLAGVPLAELTNDGASDGVVAVDCPSEASPSPTPSEPTASPTDDDDEVAVAGTKTGRDSSAGAQDLTQGGTILANTGASTGPAAIGLVLLLAGLALVVLTREREGAGE